MREIKFRGKRVDKDEFAYGDHLTGMGYKKGKHYILPLLSFYPSDCHSIDGYEVIPETIGQYTGLKDKNGKEIYEGDIIVEKIKRAHKIGERLVVCFEEFEWRGKNVNEAGTSLSLLSEYHIIEVIGNIHDNPELIKELEEKM